MDLESALFNWLQIKIVADGRPDDPSAQDTATFFDQILREDHGITSIRTEVSEDLIAIFYELNGEEQRKRFDRTYAEKLLHDIESEPRFNS
ncbi:hypothetical protein [Gorillibacterium massiliense]|uniref:hypothetical protein n=1 Tax=Gorillibacterium massiliense TaxID=1280390 RepID=UPI0004B5CD23|nr:hypothetical protein [Gorillibacterium massiliense]